ncbi:MAG: tRNA (adenosine(37)-N6)-threonylcarbamoyltransferase complex dimerization subunit type 1 TsaB [Phycisphaerales bacterium]
MLTLAIETSNPSAAPGAAKGLGPGCALGELGPGVEPRVIDSEPLRPTTRHDDDLMPCIDRLCRRAGVTPPQIRCIAVSVGPGGYTALRVAVATAKLIAESSGAKTIAVPTAAAVALATPRSDTRPFAVALAGKSDSSFITLFDHSWPGDPAQPLNLPDGRLVAAEGLAALGIGTLIADEHLPATLREQATRLGITILPPVFSPAALLQTAARLPAIDPVELLPLYAREPEAVTLWRQRGSR